ncbi:MAG: hypothetical protein LQ346_001607 [Caloplaca aetnensis]|nr:MAG: hypothetical protein LQ346_001607 [Caloplaca aetnensis]
MSSENQTSAQNEQAPSGRQPRQNPAVKRTTTAKFARLQHRQGPTDQWKDLEQAYEAQVDQSNHAEPYNVQRVTNRILGIAVRQYPSEVSLNFDEPLYGWAVKFSNINMSDIKLAEYSAGKRDFCSIRFKCTGSPESHAEHMVPKVPDPTIDKKELDRLAADLPLAKLFLQPEAMVGTEFRITVPKGSTRPEKQNCWLWPMIVWFLMSATWDGADFKITDTVSRGELGQWAREKRGLPAGAILKEWPGLGPSEWSLEREKRVLDKNHRRAEARPPGPAKLATEKPEEQTQARLQLQWRRKAPADEVVASATKQHAAYLKLNAAQKEHDEAMQEANLCSARYSEAKNDLDARREEESRYKE